MNRRNRDIEDCKALVIDANPTSRSILASMLREMGIGNVSQTSKVLDARRHLENRVFDVVLCDYHFDKGEYTGQDLLDDLRRAQLLPYSTVFIMVTGEATYARVAEAAESALDGYLIKPHTAQSLAQRVNQARARKAALQDIFEAIEADDLTRAAALCEARFHAKAPYGIYAARIGGDLLLRLNRHDDARALFEAVAKASTLPWAKLGVARAHVEAGQWPMARRVLETLLASEPGYADAHDVMGRVQLEQGDFEEALESARKATVITPSSISRVQKLGMLAHFMGQKEESVRMLERAMLVGMSSKMFDSQAIVLLAFANVDRKDGKGVQRCLDNLLHLQQKSPSERLQRFIAVIQALRALQLRQQSQVVDCINQQAVAVLEPSFDFEAACNLLALMSRVREADTAIDSDEAVVRKIAQRFCTSKATSELLAGISEPWPSYCELIRAEHVAGATLSEHAMARSLAGHPGEAVELLLERGLPSANAKLVDIARLVLQRHGARITNATEHQVQVDAFRKRFGSGHILAQVGSSSGRQAGSLALRAAKSDDADETIEIDSADA